MDKSLLSTLLDQPSLLHMAAEVIDFAESEGWVLRNMRAIGYVHDDAVHRHLYLDFDGQEGQFIKMRDPLYLGERYSAEALKDGVRIRSFAGYLCASMRVSIEQQVSA